MAWVGKWHAITHYVYKWKRLQKQSFEWLLSKTSNPYAGDYVRSKAKISQHCQAPTEHKYGTTKGDIKMVKGKDKGKKMPRDTMEMIEWRNFQETNSGNDQRLVDFVSSENSVIRCVR